MVRRGEGRRGEDEDSFCEKHLPLLFTAFANAPAEDTTLRANTVFALGACHFLNAVEPYTPRLYACLRDKSMRVRRQQQSNL